LQFAKVGAALVEGTSVRGDATTGADIDEANVVLPHAFKNVIGKGHPEFSSMRQQDAQEFFNHLLDLATRAERAAAGRLPGVDEPTSKLFEFGVETRIQCLKSQRVCNACTC
jgi:ubiquitin carboxyl-terminal hydrolase 5/13